MASSYQQGMTLLDTFLSDSRKVARNARTATNTAVAGGALMQAASDVIAARLDIITAGMVDPGKADLAEISLMSAEKMQATTESAAVLTRSLGEICERMSRSAADELHLAATAATALSSATSPAAFVAAQSAWAMGWWGRATAQALTLNTELLKAQADTLKPIHDTAVANARRLKG